MRPDPPRYLAVGRVGRPHGLLGEVRVDVLTDFPERFARGAQLYIGPEGGDPRPARVVSARPHQARLLVIFDLAADRAAAAEITGQYVYVPTEEAHDLGPGSYYEHELVGLEVVTAEGRVLGRVTSLLETGSADVLIITGSDGQHLIPMIAEVVSEVDLEAGRLTITPLPGLLD